MAPRSLSSNERLLKFSVLTNEGHRLWTGCLDKDGYGVSTEFGKKLPAHVLAYKTWKTDFDPLLFVLHKCDIRRCISPECLFQGTQQDNIKDCVAKGRHSKANKTHCNKGHELTPNNIYWRTRVNPRNGNLTTFRRCIQCCALGCG